MGGACELVQRRLWMIRNFRRFKMHLRRTHPMSALRPVLMRRWHRGSMYFCHTSLEGEVSFIKLDGQYRLLENEITAWMTLRRSGAHPGRYAQVRWFDFAGEYRSAAMEWLEAETLSRYLRKRPSPASARLLMEELAEILEDLGRAGIVHRDLTPENLLVIVNPEGEAQRLVLIDFAFAVMNQSAPRDRFVSLDDLAVLCHGYKPQESAWDDAYSCLLIFTEIERAAGISDAASRSRIEGRIGALTYSFDPAGEARMRRGEFAPQWTPPASRAGAGIEAGAIECAESSASDSIPRVPKQGSAV